MSVYLKETGVDNNGVLTFWSLSEQNVPDAWMLLWHTWA
jgi:hypothetical protein